MADRLRDEGKTAVFVGDRQAVRGLIAVADTRAPEREDRHRRAESTGDRRGS